jgi:hypothetical protein
MTLALDGNNWKEAPIKCTVALETRLDCAAVTEETVPAKSQPTEPRRVRWVRRSLACFADRGAESSASAERFLVSFLRESSSGSGHAKSQVAIDARGSQSRSSLSSRHHILVTRASLCRPLAFRNPLRLFADPLGLAAVKNRKFTGHRWDEVVAIDRVDG